MVDGAGWRRNRERRPRRMARRCPNARAAAEADLTGAAAGDSSLAPAWYTLADLYRYSGRFSQAEDAARQALEADAFLSDAYTVTSGLFFTALNLERYDDAREWCAKGKRQFPQSSTFIACEFRLVASSGAGPGAVADACRLLQPLDHADTDPQMLGDRHLLVAAVLAPSGPPQRRPPPIPRPPPPPPT